ncbi:acyl-CoA dehydrogenase family protein [Chloroflexota bacterium]
MSYSFAEEQEMIRSLGKEFFKREWSIALAREIWEKKRDFPLELYQKMGGVGCLGLLIPEEYGGMGRTWVDTAIFYEEAGYVLFPVIHHFYSAVLGAQMILAFGTEEQKRDLLPELAQGNIIFTMGWTEPQMRHDTSDISSTTSRATLNNGTYTITGTKLPVRNLALAHYIITPAKINEGSDVALFMVETKSDGLVIKTMYDVGGDILNEVIYEGVKVPADRMLVKPVPGTQVAAVLEKCKVLRCAEMVGGSQRVMEMSVDHVKQRVQFDRFIGSFQSIQHRLADDQLEIFMARLFAHYAARRCDEVADPLAPVSMAIQVATNAYIKVSNDGSHVHGGYGIMHMTDVSLYFRRAKAIELEMGAPYTRQDRIADAIGL